MGVYFFADLLSTVFTEHSSYICISSTLVLFISLYVLYITDSSVLYSSRSPSLNRTATQQNVENMSENGFKYYHLVSIVKIKIF